MEASALQAPAAIRRRSAPLLRFRTDDQLVALFRMGNDEAFRVIHDRYRQRLFGYTRQMLAGSRSDAEDALQDVFLRAYSALRADNRPITLRAWLYRVAHNRCIDQLRRPVPPAAEVFEISRGPLHDPLSEAERREDLRRLVEDVRRLPEQQRSALLMRELEGLTYAELCDALEVTLPAVKSLLVRARIGLVEAIEARDAACPDIRDDLAMAHDRGVRASGKARRHMRDCDGCRSYRSALKATQDGFSALSPGVGPLALAAKLLGLGGAGSGAAAGSSAVTGGGVAAIGGSATVTASKVAAIVASAAVVGGGAVEVREQIIEPAKPKASQARPAAKAAAVAAPAAAAPLARHVVAPPAAADGRHHADRTTASTPDLDATAVAVPDVVSDATPETLATGGSLAPEEEPASVTDEAPVTVVPTDKTAKPEVVPAQDDDEPSTPGTPTASGAASDTGHGSSTPSPVPSGGVPGGAQTPAP